LGKVHSEHVDVILHCSFPLEEFSLWSQKWSVWFCSHWSWM